ncbi:cell division protein DIVIC [Bacillus canaveralius]|uniref:Cell division protein DIVIC n=1 Tax=Bacillus canaveralius TaxID=1403243 RepID=A0A2N5GHG3_9BACI|nr:septum formation initiator family protein [Bacillus canaveralius]PLR80245.1 cell division protein DIVIC [Bacillus canaveralius]PLS00470.1 cell division protein DIVIC [Bacillus canaveralius]
MSAIRKRKVARIQTTYAKQQETAELSAQSRRKLLFRRLAAFFVLVIIISFSMISTLIAQSSTIEEKQVEKEKLLQQLAKLEKNQVVLEEEIVKLHDDEYIAKLARREYFLSDINEIIFQLPEDKKVNSSEE